MSQRGRVRVEQSAKRVRVYLGGELVADTTKPRLVWEIPYYPAYYIPEEDVKVELTPTGEKDHSPSRGDADLFDVKTSKTAEKAAKRYTDSPIEELRNLVRFDWNAMDEWFEEDEPVYTHPRDPYSRVDVLNSTRHVRVVIDGVTVADSHRPTILFETGLPPRYYLPLTDVDQTKLEPSETESHCPYKGMANWWSVEVNGRTYRDYVWTYRSPFPESQKVQGLVSFYNEKVDIYVDGQLLERPKTPFS